MSVSLDSLRINGVSGEEVALHIALVEDGGDGVVLCLDGEGQRRSHGLIQRVAKLLQHLRTRVAYVTQQL